VQFRKTSENHRTNACRETGDHINAGKLVDAEYASYNGQDTQQYAGDGRDIARNTNELVHDLLLPNEGAPLVRLSRRARVVSAFRRRRILSAANAKSASKVNAPTKQPIAK
jgi:hypothetical protein